MCQTTCRQWAWCGLCAVVVVAVALLAGCPSRDSEQAVALEPPPETVVQAPAGEAPADDDRGPAPTTAAEEFEYTETPTVATIPAGPVAGMMHGEAFAAQTIRIEKKVKGRVALVMRDREKSWVAGEFEAPVFEW